MVLPAMALALDGIAAALLSGSLRNPVYGVSTLDSASIVAAATVLTAIALLAALIPAVRA